MSDQAATLRALRDQSVSPLRSRRYRSIAVSGGKGGVGKSTLALGLSLAYARAGSSTLLVDTDVGMADLNLLLGVAPERSLLDALHGAALEEVLVSAHGVSLLPALNGSYVLANMAGPSRQRTLELIDGLTARFDTVILDISAGIAANQSTFSAAAAERVVVVDPEPLSLADAYACLKVLAQEYGVTSSYVVPNRVRSRAQAEEVVGRLAALVSRFLDLELVPLPSVPFDPAVPEAAHAGVPLLAYRPECPAARAIRQVARALDAHAVATDCEDVPRRFWRHTFLAETQGDAP